MGRKTAFRNHRGDGGLIGKSAFFARVSSGQNNELAFAFQKDRALVTPKDGGEATSTTGPITPLVPLVPPPAPGGSFSASFSASFSGGG